VSSAEQPYVIGYPTTNTTCSICQADLGSSNLEIRKHLIDIHSAKSIKYACEICHKEYDTINSVRSHHNICKKKGTTLAPTVPIVHANNNILLTQITPSTSNRAHTQSPSDNTARCADQTTTPRNVVISGPTDAEASDESSTSTTPEQTRIRRSIEVRDLNASITRKNSSSNETDPSKDTDNENDNDTNNGISRLQCTECEKQGYTFNAKDNKGLITHMRYKHRNAYEDSKKVATKRIAWDPDEDVILAELEISLKTAQKGQILSRLTTEWNKLAKKSGANLRTQEAIRGRRQTAEYKRTKATVMFRKQQPKDSGPEDDSSPSDESKTSSTNNRSASNNTSSDEDEHDIRGYVKHNLIDRKIALSNSMEKAIQAYISNNDNSMDPVKLSLTGIQEAISRVREKSTKNSRTKARTSRLEKPINNARRLEKSNKLAYYQRLYDHDKAKLVSEVFDGVASNIEPPPMNIAYDHYKNIWSKTVQDTEPIRQKLPLVDPCLLLSPITSQEIEWAVNNTKRDTAKGPDNITLSEAKAIMKKELHAAFNI
jgi:hypothetical protein